MLKLALCVAYGALMRSESRGAHYREDYPRRNDADWLKRTLAVWARVGDTLPTLSYEAVHVMRMELPPGWRGYGAQDFISHPDGARRAAEIDAIKAQLAGADRFALQRALDALRGAAAAAAGAAATNASTRDCHDRRFDRAAQPPPVHSHPALQPVSARGSSPDSDL